MSLSLKLFFYFNWILTIFTTFVNLMLETVRHFNRGKYLLFFMENRCYVVIENITLQLVLPILSFVLFSGSLRMIKFCQNLGPGLGSCVGVLIISWWWCLDLVLIVVSWSYPDGGVLICPDSVVLIICWWWCLDHVLMVVSWSCPDGDVLIMSW